MYTGGVSKTRHPAGSFGKNSRRLVAHQGGVGFGWLNQFWLSCLPVCPWRLASLAVFSGDPVHASRPTPAER